MPLDPVLAERVAGLHTVTLDEVLLGTADLPEPVNLELEDVVVVDANVPAPRGAVLTRVYRPADLDSVDRVLVWAHGGAWLGGDLDMPEAHSVAQRVAAGVRCAVVSVGYALAPTHVHPVPVDDIVAVVEAARAGGLRDHGVEAPERVALGGASAGGHLAALATLRLRDLGTAPDALWLAYPAVDPLDGPYPADRPADCPTILWFDATLTPAIFMAYLGGASDAPGDAVPARGDLRGLPPTLVTTCGYDALAPQARSFATALREAGVDVEHQDAPDLLHGYLNEIAVVPTADAALTRHLDWLSSQLGS